MNDTFKAEMQNSKLEINGHEIFIKNLNITPEDNWTERCSMISMDIDLDTDEQIQKFIGMRPLLVNMHVKPVSSVVITLPTVVLEATIGHTLGCTKLNFNCSWRGTTAHFKLFVDNNDIKMTQRTQEKE